MLQEIIVLDADVNTWEEAIYVASQALCKTGFVKESFFKACVEREKLFPTGLPTRIPVAIPHTDPGHVTVPAICILRLKRPVAFVSMEDGDECVHAEYVFNMALQQAEDQVPMIQTIIETVQNSSLLEELKTLTLDEIYKLIVERWQKEGALQKR